MSLGSEDQHVQRPLIHIADEVDPSLNDSQKYSSMGSDPDKSSVSERCLCGLMHVKRAAFIIGFIELLFIVYQIVSTLWFFDKNEESYVFAVTLILTSFVLALIAVVLLAIGLYKSTPFLLVPHLLMQCAICVASAFLCGYLIILLIGGTSVEVETIFYEDSPRGELGMTLSSHYPPVELSVIARGLRSVLFALLLITVGFLACQLWFLYVVNQCYNYLHQRSLEKPLINNGSTDTKASKI
uniref:MARVEL domain-containing protein n=1 Tax=Panagrellus redivivus TaxID=6233 RepID=A0A7E4VVZ8_PANRE